MPGGSNFCTIASTPSTSAGDAPSSLGDVREIGRQIAGLVDQIDQIASDQPLHRIADRKRKLLGEMIRKRGLRGNERLEIVVAVVRRTATPFGVGRRRCVLGGARCGLRRLFREDVLETRVEGLLHLGAAAEIAVHPLLGGRVEVASAAFLRVKPASSVKPLSSPLSAASVRSPRSAGSPSSLDRSSSGLRSSSSSTNATRSRLDSCSSLIACISCGVITSDCVCRNSSRCVSAIGREPIQ